MSITFERGSKWRRLRDKLVEKGVAQNEEPYAIATEIIKRASPSGRERLLRRFGLGRSMAKRRARFAKGSAEALAWGKRMLAFRRGRKPKDMRMKPRAYDGRRWKPISTSGSSDNPMARRIGRRRTATVPLATVLPIAASFIVPPRPGWASPMDAGMRGDFKALGESLLDGWCFYNTPTHNFDINGGLYLKMTIAGAIVSLLASKLGINRRLGRARIPVIRI